MTQLAELAKPFPPKFMGKDSSGRDAVDHTVVTQRLLQIVGPYDLEIKEVLRSETPPVKTKNKEHPGGYFVTGVVCRLTLKVDGVVSSIEETGACENAAMKDGDGERLKHAISDAIKRCGMRLGLGLHMWAEDNYFLYDVLQRDSASETDSARPLVSSPTTTPAKGGEPAQPNSSSTDQKGTAKSLGEADATDSKAVLTQATPGDPPLTDPDELLAIASWDEIKPVSRSAVLQGITEGLTTNGLVPKKVEELADLDPVILADIKRRLLEKKGAVA